MSRLARGKASIQPGEKRAGWAAAPESFKLKIYDFDEVQAVHSHGAGFVGYQYSNLGYPLLADKPFSMMIGKTVFRPAQNIAGDLDDLCSDIQARINDAMRSNEPHKGWLIAAEFKQRFIAIHPYNDGCGRVSRLITERILAEFGLPMPAWKKMQDHNLNKTIPQYAALLEQNHLG